MTVTTYPVNIQTLPRTSDTVLMMRVAMAVNDIASGYFLLNQPRKISDPTLKEMQQGLAMYAIRLQISHFREALWIVDEVKKAESCPTSRIQSCISRIPRRFQKQYTLLKKALPGQPDWEIFQKRVKAIRDGVTFHYKQDTTAAVITGALEQMSRSLSKPVQNIVIGNDVRESRVAIADAVVDRAVSNMLLDADPATIPDAQSKIDDEIAWCHERARAFHNFGFALCVEYFTKS